MNNKILKKISKKGGVHRWDFSPNFDFNYIKENLLENFLETRTNNHLAWNVSEQTLQ